MKQLNWFDPDEPDPSMQICDVPITLNPWIGPRDKPTGGIVLTGGRYRFLVGHGMHGSEPWYNVAAYAVPSATDDEFETVRDCTPVYPPRGFGGLSEEEIWIDISEMPIGYNPSTAGPQDMALYDTGDIRVGISPYNHGSPVSLVAGITRHYTDEIEEANVSDMHTFITALQNSQVLSARLRGEHD